MSRLWRPQQGRPAARVPESGTQPLRDIDRNDQLTTWCVGPDRLQVGLSHAGHPGPSTSPFPGGQRAKPSSVWSRRAPVARADDQRPPGRVGARASRARFAPTCLRRFRHPEVAGVQILVLEGLRDPGTVQIAAALSVHDNRAAGASSPATDPPSGPSTVSSTMRSPAWSATWTGCALEHLWTAAMRVAVSTASSCTGYRWRRSGSQGPLSPGRAGQAPGWSGVAGQGPRPLGVDRQTCGPRSGTSMPRAKSSPGGDGCRSRWP